MNERMNERVPEMTSRSPSGGNYCSLFANGEHLDLRQDVFVFVRVLSYFHAGEGVGLVAAEDEDLAITDDLIGDW